MKEGRHQKPERRKIELYLLLNVPVMPDLAKKGEFLNTSIYLIKTIIFILACIINVDLYRFI